MTAADPRPEAYPERIGGPQGVALGEIAPDRETFRELAARQEANYPPYGRLLLVRVESQDEDAAIRATAAPHAPWHVVPADSKPFARLAVSVALSEALDGLDLRYPEVDEAERAALEEARAALAGE